MNRLVSTREGTPTGGTHDFGTSAAERNCYEPARSVLAECRRSRIYPIVGRHDAGFNTCVLGQ